MHGKDAGSVAGESTRASEDAARRRRRLLGLVVGAAETVQPVPELRRVLNDL
jgi:hypothetical protein